MSDTSRRKFLAVAGAGAAAAGTLGIAAPAASAAPVRASKTSAKKPVVAYIHDHKSGELRLMVDDREIVVHDRDLVTRILNAAGGK